MITDKLLIPEIPLNYNKIKIDVGLSYSAVHSSVWMHKEPNLFVFGFEPLPMAVKNLSEFNGIIDNPLHFQRKHKNRFQIYNVALSDVKEITQQKFYVNDLDMGCSSFWKPKKNSTIDKISKEINVSVWNLEMWFEKFYEKYPNRFPYINHIKVDTQGCDLKVAKGAGKWLKEKVVFITLEADGRYYENCILEEKNLDEYMVDELGFIKVTHSHCADPTYLNPKYENLSDIYIMQGLFRKCDIKRRIKMLKGKKFIYTKKSWKDRRKEK